MTAALIVAVALALAGIACWYGSPLIALQQMQAAAKARVAPSCNDPVDHAKLRQHLKAQLGARLAGAIGPGAYRVVACAVATKAGDAAGARAGRRAGPADRPGLRAQPGRGSAVRAALPGA